MRADPVCEGQRGADEGKMMAKVNDICNFAKVNPQRRSRSDSWNRSSMKETMMRGRRRSSSLLQISA
jgi:hypothetical protein